MVLVNIDHVDSRIKKPRFKGYARGGVGGQGRDFGVWADSTSITKSVIHWSQVNSSANSRNVLTLACFITVFRCETGMMKMFWQLIPEQGTPKNGSLRSPMIMARPSLL